ncbi:hypothetical protein QWZ06_23400 [Chryseobacterium tructae]|uniref:hypothetical protein n=1 Tax=Chryseobacterium tructae TaxID=1037380 RepID=UPI0025B460BD|nr:hypothetical protein [Chryseobacterium tructae]MDN3694969.1 hypothetical protein [Chryseobacterium tructae]
MGIGFVILFHLIIIAILAFICAIIGCLLIYFISGKEKRKRKVILVCIAPFVAFYTFYIVGIIGLSIISENKKVDIGIGDAWYIPLKNNHQLLFIDIPEQASINKNNGETQISMVARIEEKGNQIFGKTFDNEYFLLDTKTDMLKKFTTEKELVTLHSDKKLKLEDVTKFYSERKNNIMGYWPLLIVFLSLIISIGVVYILKLVFNLLIFEKSSYVS